MKNELPTLAATVSSSLLSSSWETTPHLCLGLAAELAQIPGKAKVVSARESTSREVRIFP